MHINEKKILPLIGTQQGIWLADQISERKNTYVISHCIELQGDIETELLQQAIRQGLAEADTVTAEYIAAEQGACQHIRLGITAADIPAPEYFDYREHSQSKSKALAWMWQDTHADLTLDSDKPLYRQALFQVIDEQQQPQWLWYQRYHHIMLDGFSFTALTRRIAAIYSALANQQIPADSPFCSVEEVVEEYLDYQTSALREKDQQFWQHYCEDWPAAATLSPGSNNPLSPRATAEQQAENLVTYDFCFPSGNMPLLQQLTESHARAQKSRLTPPDLLLGLFAAYLYRHTGQSSQTLGVPFMRRMGSAAIHSLAPVVNVLPVRVNMSADMDWLTVAAEFKQALKQVRQHQRYDAEQIQRDLHWVGSGQKLYGAVINYKMFDYQLDFAGTAGVTRHLATGPIDDFEFNLVIEKDQIHVELRADAERYTRQELAVHAERIQQLLQEWLALPEQAVSRLTLITPSEQADLAHWSQGLSFSKESGLRSIVDFLARQVELNPAATALVCGHVHLTFDALVPKVDQLTRLLISRGAGPDRVVAVAIPRSAESVIAMLAVLNSGATFLPLDLDYPADRIAMMCEDACPTMLLSKHIVSVELPTGLKRIDLDNPTLQSELEHLNATPLADNERRGAITPDSIAYIIFTSGSTGRPKGVMNTHGALLNLLLSHRHTIYQPALSAVRKKYPGRALHAAHTHSFSFDSSWLQIFWMLQGQELYVFDEDTRRDAYGLVQEVERLKIDAMDLPPSFLAQMLSNGLFAEGRHHPSLILIGGEAAPAALWQQLREFPELQAHNLYGPTEYTVDTLRASLADSERPVIGRPIGNTIVHVLDARLQPVPVGVVGELYLSGQGLAKGYLARGGLTASRFVANPFSGQGDCMYRSGDLVRWNSLGRLEFVGRGDDQVKVRGYRVEIGEVENALSLLPEVESVVVLAQAINNSHRLIGYCVIPGLSENQQAERSQDLLAALRRALPDYMVPAALVILNEFPRNVSGKVDRKRLPAPHIQSAGGRASNAEEALLCELMARVLKLQKAGVEDDFFALGGDSISAIMLCTELRRSGYELRPSAVFSQRNARQMAQSLGRKETLEFIPAASFLSESQHADLQQRYGHFAAAAPLLPLQKGMLFHAQVGDKSASYNAFTRLHFKGAVDAVRLQRALNRVLGRYPQLAGLFDIESGDEPVFLLPERDEKLLWPWQQHDLSHLPQREKLAAQEAIEQALLQQQYATDKFTGLLNAALISLDTEQHLLVLVIHHLVVDGWSTPLLLRDLLRAYRQPENNLPPAAADYAQLITQLAQRDHSQSHALWQQALSHVQPTILFDGIVASEKVEEYSLQLPADITARLMAEIRMRGLTLNVLMQGVWAILLSNLCGRSDVVFGTPVSGRSAAIEGIEEQVGLFLNTLPVRVQMQPQLSLWEQLPAMQQHHIQLLEQDGLGLAEIQRIAGVASLFDTLLVVENYPDSEYLSQQLEGADGNPLRVGDIHNRGYSHYPLALLVLPGEQLTLLVENRGAVADAAGVAQKVEQILRRLLEQPAQPLAQYPLQSAREIQFLQQANATAKQLAPATLRSALAEQAARTPNALALVDQRHHLTYAEVRQQVCGLARQLIAEGVKPGDIVAVALPRSVQLSLALMAIIEAGAAYLPLDLGYPDERLLYMLGDAKPRLLITTDATRQRFSNSEITTPVLVFDALLTHTTERPAIEVGITPDHPAYIIYTSGTTGRPKGVLVSHRAICNRIEWMQHQYPMTLDDVVLQKTPCSFDVSVWEFFWPLMVGSSLVMAEPEAHRDPQALLQTIEKYRVTCMHFVPSMLAIFTAHSKTLYGQGETLGRSLRWVFCSGEALSKAVAQDFAQYFSAQLHNLYGPTEAAVDVTYSPAFGDLSAGGAGVPIGRPVWNTQLRVLDHCLRPVPVGVSGELYLCGVQLAMGYLGRADLSSTRFVADPSGNGERMYRTGDVVRWLDNGEVEYLGRADDQIKIRGQRIELGEIETLLLQQAEVVSAVVHAVVLGNSTSTHEDNRQLVAYVVLAEDSELNSEQLKASLQNQLPAHMVPVAYVALDKLPLSANGKLDRKALPIPSSQRDDVNRSGRLPVRGLESRLAEVFAKVLDVEQVFADDDFFAVGGHSLLAMRLAAEIRRDLQRPVSVGQIMVSPTVEKLAAHLNQDVMLNDFGSEGFAQFIRLREGQGAPLFCVYPGSGFAWQYSVLSRYLKNDQPIIGLQSPRPQGLIASSASMDELLDKQLQIIRSLQPQGPYYLLGYSLGGTVAYGVAARLRAQGETVNFLGLLDTYPAEAHDWSDPQGAEAALGAEREQEQLLSDAYAGEDQEIDELLRREKEAMLSQIFANYKDAVRLLSQTKTPDYDGEVTLFIAEQSLPEYIQPVASWRQHVQHLDVHSLAHCSHENILSPESLETLGPLLNSLLERASLRGEIAQLEKLVKNSQKDKEQLAV
ncbi:MAG TPA: amino acid adenylation domain-containing protein [Cellvibrio sp.]|nr:amino acid adenylation domain-containing protein [Cellvibrio sp.]